MRFSLKHATDPDRRALYGLDHALGFFVEVRDRGRIVAQYDRIHPPYDDRNGAVQCLIQHGFFTKHDLNEAATLVGSFMSDELEPGAVRCAAEVIENLSRASGS